MSLWTAIDGAAGTLLAWIILTVAWLVMRLIRASASLAVAVWQEIEPEQDELARRHTAGSA